MSSLNIQDEYLKCMSVSHFREIISMQLRDIEHPLCLGFLFEKGDYPLDILCCTRKRLS